ncbi:MAG TPA: SGNH/GDSL hydrolase family protein [Pirellulales bacterium]|jgi:lysophospholipase L1-like esterase
MSHQRYCSNACLRRAVRFFCVSVALLILLEFFSHQSAQADILHGIATMGDSSSIKSAPFKFPVMLQNNRGLNFGGTNLPYVHAVGGSTSASMLVGNPTPSDPNQPQRVAADVAAGKVSVATLLVGNNDYGQIAVPLLSGGLTPTELANFETGVVNNIESAVTTVLNSGIQGFLLGSVPRTVAEPVVSQYFPSVPPDQLPGIIDLVDSSQERINAQLLDFANAHHIPFVDFFGFEKSLGTADHITVGGVPIALTKGPDATYFFVDNLHPGYVGNAILSNFWMTALNVAYGTHLTLFSDHESLNMAGLGNQYTGETFSNSLNYADFIHFNPVPEPSSIVLAITAIAGMVAWSWRRPEVACVVPTRTHG